MTDPTIGRLIDDTLRLVRCESPSSDAPALATSAATLAQLAHEWLGTTPEITGDHHVVWRSAGPTRALLVGHHDTVWPLGTIDRLPAVVTDGRMSGPGCFDMKGGIVSALAAVASLADPTGVTVVMTADEEIGSPTGRVLIESLAAGAECALVFEPAGGSAVKTARKGVGLYRMDLVGRAAHAGLEPHKGVNALIAMAEVIDQLTALADPARGTTVTPTRGGGGTAINVVPAAASLDVDVRVEEAGEADRVDAAIRAIAAPATGATVSVSGGPNRPPFGASSSERLYERLCSVAADLEVGAPAGVGVGGGSDGNFTAALGVPTIDGLGAIGGGAHAEDEHVLTAPWTERVRLVSALLESLLARPLER